MFYSFSLKLSIRLECMSEWLLQSPRLDELLPVLDEVRKLHARLFEAVRQETGDDPLIRDLVSMFAPQVANRMRSPTLKIDGPRVIGIQSGDYGRDESEDEMAEEAYLECEALEASDDMEGYAAATQKLEQTTRQPFWATVEIETMFSGGQLDLESFLGLLPVMNDVLNVGQGGLRPMDFGETGKNLVFQAEHRAKETAEDGDPSIRKAQWLNFSPTEKALAAIRSFDPTDDAVLSISYCYAPRDI